MGIIYCIKFLCKIFVKKELKKIIAINENELHIFITVLPVKGKANKEVIDSLSEAFSIPRYTITIESGLTTRYKIIAIKTTKNREELLGSLIG
jgi:uncharacterized protein (TIGR00251 family)